MITKPLALKASLLLSLITVGQALAQTLPDEINHPRYLSIYQSLEQVLNTKISEYEKLAAEKIQVEKMISMMEKDQVALPARNAELQRTIDNKRKDIGRIDGEIRALDEILVKTAEDLRRIDDLLKQYAADHGKENSRYQSIDAHKKQVINALAGINLRLQREMNEEAQSEKSLNDIKNEFESASKNKADREQEQRQLTSDVAVYRRDLPGLKVTLNQSNNLLNTKRPLLADAKTNLPIVRNEIRVEEPKLAPADGALNPQKARLAQLRSELARLQPELSRLEKENTDLRAKIQANNVKIAANNVTALETKKTVIENALAGLEGQLNVANENLVNKKEEIKPSLIKLDALQTELRNAGRTGNRAEVARIQAEIKTLQEAIAPQKAEVTRLEKVAENIAFSMAPKKMELAGVVEAISRAGTIVATLQKENADASMKIAANEAIIQERSSANAGLIKQVSDLEVVVRALQAERDSIQTRLTSLRQQEAAYVAQINTLGPEVQRLERDTQALSIQITNMERTVLEAPEILRRLDLNVRKLQEIIAQKSSEFTREAKLLERIRRDRADVEQERDSAQANLDRTNNDLAASVAQLRSLDAKIQQERSSHEGNVRYKDETSRKVDILRQNKMAVEKEIAEATQEQKINDQDIATIKSELPKERTKLAVVTPKVVSAENARNEVQKRSQEANSQYQSRHSLYNRYFNEAQALGVQRASLGSMEGQKAGEIDAKMTATKYGVENALAHAKWEALLRGYVHGEIGGYHTGYNLGLSSTDDSSRGEEEGKKAGERRAREHANHVIKPAFYAEEFQRRIREDEMPKRNRIPLTMNVNDEIKMLKSFSTSVSENEVPELTSYEVSQAKQIATSLDGMIEKAPAEINQILIRRRALSDPKNVYVLMTRGENAQRPNCEGVYMNVKDFIDTCRGSYIAKYEDNFNVYHKLAFNRDYVGKFNDQVKLAFNGELKRLYPDYLQEATSVARAVGLSLGKADIYEQQYKKNEKLGYTNSLPREQERVEDESILMINDHMASNSVLALKGLPKLTTNAPYGMGPGAEIDIKVLLKNLGSMNSNGSSIVRITNVSSNVVLARREVPIGSVPARSVSELSIMKLKVSDNAFPGSSIVIAGEIIHPGNHYAANRVEPFRVSETLGVDPSITTNLDYDTSPKVSTLAFVKKHEIDFTLSPKFAGVKSGYEVTLEEVGVGQTEILTRSISTPVLGQGAAKKLIFVYKLSKNSRGKTVTLRMTVKNSSRVIESFDLVLRPQ